MARIEPFRGMRYNPEAVGSIADLTAPPFDVISPEAQRELYDRHPVNFVRLEYGRHGNGADRYASAKRLMNAWLQDGTLIEENRPAFYVYEQTFQLPEAEHIERRRLTAFAAIRLEPWGNGVYPHERTLAAPKADRMRLMEACRANLSPILGAAQDPRGTFNAALRATADASEPAVDAVDPIGQRHRLWVVDEPSETARILHAFNGADVTIADGHHRYETALAYRSRHPSGAADFALIGLTSSGAEDLVILPIHRLITGAASERLSTLAENLEKAFQVRRRPLDEELTDETVDFSLYMGGEELLDAKLRGDAIGALADLPSALAELSVSKLHAVLLREALHIDTNEEAGQRQVSYTTRRTEALEKVRGGEAQLAALTRPILMSEVEKTARAGCAMPQKSTYFYPKLPSGLVARRLI